MPVFPPDLVLLLVAVVVCVLFVAVAVAVAVVVVVVVGGGGGGGANASRRAALFPCNCCVLLFEHFTRCRCWHVCRTCSLHAQGG